MWKLLLLFLVDLLRLSIVNGEDGSSAESDESDSDVCLTTINDSLFQFFGGIMELGDQSPEYCLTECLKQGLVANGKRMPFTGIANATFCFCGLDYDMTRGDGKFQKDFVTLL